MNTDGDRCMRPIRKTSPDRIGSVKASRPRRDPGATSAAARWLSRRCAYQILIIEEFARVGVETLFVLQFQGMIAEYERAQILERSRRGKVGHNNGHQ
jgi:hypothetical protein